METELHAETTGYMHFTVRPRDTCFSLWDHGIHVFHCETKGCVCFTVRPRDTCVSLWDHGIHVFHCEAKRYVCFTVRPRDTCVSLWDHGIRVFHCETKGYVCFTVRPRDTCVSLWNHGILLFHSGIKVYAESKIVRNHVVLWFNHAIYFGCYIRSRDGIQNVAKFCLSRTGHSSVLVSSETVTKQQIVMNNLNILSRHTEIVREF